MEQLLAEVDQWLRRHRPEFFSGLRAGATTKTLDSLDRRFSLVAPVEFRQLYAWRNGQSSVNTSSLQGNWMFMPLAQVVEAKEELDGMIGSDFEDANWWRREWLPFLANGGGDHICLDFGPHGNGPEYRLVEFRHDEARRATWSSSLTVWLKDLTNAMKEGRYTYH